VKITYAWQSMKYNHPYLCSMRNISVLFLLVLASPLILVAQEESELDLKKEVNQYYSYDEDYLPASFHAAMRDSLRSLLPDSTAAVFFSSPERKRSNDVYYEYHQDPNFYYLSGYGEPNGMLIIYKEKQGFGKDSSNEVLFVQPRDPSAEVWNGRRLGAEGAKEALQVNKVMLTDDFQYFDPGFEDLKRVYFITPEALEGLNAQSSRYIDGLYQFFNEKLGEPSEVAEKHLGKMMASLRQKKHPEEMKLLEKAIQITCEAQNELMKQINEDMKEYQTEAIIEYVFKREGAEYPGFPSIQGSGENSCILHYTNNRRPLINGGLLLSDVGAEYHGYTADVTRTIPPSGKFSKEEKLIYDIVYEAQSAGIDSAKEGNSFWLPHMTASKVVYQGLKELGIVKDPSEVRNYFMHGTSHYLGLDVHDPGLYGPLKAGQVITVEPGIYIAEGSDCDPKWWNIGVRIEDDILITEKGPVNLSACSPRKSNEIEEFMHNERSK